MYRNAMIKLLAWSDGPHRKPLIVNGARQVGKTWLVLTFGANRYDSVAHVVFLENEDMKRAFAGSLEADRLLTIIGAATGTNPRDGRTLVFLDEIQECPRAITALKMFCEQRARRACCRSGIPPRVALNRERKKDGDGTSWPVGKVDYLDLHPLSFDEFVREIGNSALADAVSQGDADLISVFSERLTDLLRTYYYVGGMPEAVCRYSETGDFAAARAVQQTLLADYEHDFSKHVESALEVERIHQTWHSVPVQLARESDLRRFSYASVREGGRGRDYRDAVAWLVDAGLVTRIPRVTNRGSRSKGMPTRCTSSSTYLTSDFWARRRGSSPACSWREPALHRVQGRLCRAVRVPAARGGRCGAVLLVGGRQAEEGRGRLPARGCGVPRPC